MRLLLPALLLMGGELFAREKTVGMWRALEHSGLAQRREKSLLLDGKEYQLLSSGLYPSQEVRWICPSELPFQVEALYHDPEQQQQLEMAYERFVSRCYATSLEEMLHLLLHFVERGVMDPFANTERARTLLAKTILEWLGPLSAISLNSWVEKKVGSCKPMSCALLWLLRRAIDEKLPPFSGDEKIFFMRGYIHISPSEWAGHAWALLRTESSCWILDPSWGRMISLSSPESCRLAQELYGPSLTEFCPLSEK